ncbi:hypothetical protein NEF87_004276 [Candidatus Lokiarchaeum ossiferum]|uniref:ABC transmembrane type-2 domain-containing protein n=1 Tax=Candidatus Lokiarchaeum ossiferum TaxID=2951803 RepID=A0ABY6HX97_9ARCH|nr:hypothetical protein NEF87_004276 [Candidatus Lokiarchaeum sp. B-35]
MEDKGNITVIKPKDLTHLSIFETQKEIIDDLKKNKWLTAQFIKRNFLSIHKQSFLGFLWAFIFPILNVLTFVFLNESGIFISGVSEVPYPIYATLGMAYWQLFSSSIMACTYSIISTGGMIKKINFSLKPIVFSSIGYSVITFFTQTLLVVILLLIYGYVPNIVALLASIVFIIPIIFLSTGFGLIFAIFNTIAHDVASILTAILPFLMLITPVLYIVPETGIIKFLSTINPVYYLISFPRDLILFSSSSLTTEYFITVVFSIVCFWILLTAFHVTEKRIKEIL